MTSRARTRSGAVAALAVAPLLLALAWRVGDLAVPPQSEQSWRDSDGLGVARCFVREGFDLLRPRVVERGATSGIVGMEFPLVNAAGAVLMEIGGVRNWLARLPCWLALIPLMLGGWALGRRLLGDDAAAAMAAGCLVLQPLVIIYARKAVPEVPMLASLTWGMVLAYDALFRQSLPRAVGAGVLFATAAVLKPTGFGVAVPLAIWLLRALRERREARARVWAAAATFAVLPLAATVLWYSHARALTVEHGLSAFKLHHDWFEWIRALPQRTFLAALFFRIFHLYLLWPTVILMALRWRDTIATAKRHPDVVAWSAASVLAAMLFGMHLRAHPYYALPLLVPLALFVGAFAARVCASVRRPELARYAFMAVFALSAVLRAEARIHKRHDPFGNYDRARLAAAMARLPQGGLTIATDQWTNVVSLVILDRIGWALPPKVLTPEEIAKLRSQGATLLVETSFGGWLSPESRAALPPPIWSDDQLRAYDLTIEASRN